MVGSKRKFNNKVAPWEQKIGQGPSPLKTIPIEDATPSKKQKATPPNTLKKFSPITSSGVEKSIDSTRIPKACSSSKQKFIRNLDVYEGEIEFDSDDFPDLKDLDRNRVFIPKDKSLGIPKPLLHHSEMTKSSQASILSTLPTPTRQTQPSKALRTDSTVPSFPIEVNSSKGQIKSHAIGEDGFEGDIGLGGKESLVNTENEDEEYEDDFNNGNFDLQPPKTKNGKQCDT